MAAAGQGSALQPQQRRPLQRRLWTRVVELGGQRQRSQGAASDADPGGDGGGGGAVGDAVIGDDGEDDEHQLKMRRRYMQPSFQRHWQPLYCTEPFTQQQSKGNKQATSG